MKFDVPNECLRRIIFVVFDIEEWQPRATVGMGHAMLVYECIPTNAIDECTGTLLNYERAANQRYWFQIQRPVVVARDDSELQWNISSNQMERDNISLTCSWQPMSTHGIDITEPQSAVFQALWTSKHHALPEIVASFSHGLAEKKIHWTLTHRTSIHDWRIQLRWCFLALQRDSNEAFTAP